MKLRAMIQSQRRATGHLALVAMVACVPVLTSTAATSGDEEIPLKPGLVTLLRDRYGMAHLYAAREEDGFYGLGYAYAEDRLEQLLVSYLRLRGELAQTFGAGPLDHRSGLGPTLTHSIDDTVASDRMMKQLGFLEEARVNLRQLPPQLQRNLESFIAGMRAYLRKYPDRAPAWTPELEPALPIAQLAFTTASEVGEMCARRATRPASARHRPATERPGEASNAWALAPSRTAERVVYFSSDSHGPAERFGSVFYAWRMHAGDLDVLSFDVSASASFFFAHTPHFAWGWTEGPRQIGECYAVRTEPGRPQEFRFDGTLQRMESVPYRIEVKNGQAIEGVFDYTQHNGIRSPVMWRDGDVAYVGSTPYMGRAGLSAAVYYAMAKARTRSQLFAALGQREIYPANLLIGGRDGLIMYIRPGRIPVHAPGVDASKVVDGNTAATAWRGIHSYASLLKLIDPPQGFVSNSNVSPDQMYATPVLKPEDYPRYFSFDSGLSGTRQLRLIELLGAAKELSIEQAKEIVMDEKLYRADLWRPAIGAAAKAHPDVAATGGPDFTLIAGELARFDGFLRKESPAALYFVLLRNWLSREHWAEVDAIVDAVENRRALDAQQSRLIALAILAVRQELLQACGRVNVEYGQLHRVGRGGVLLPSGGGAIRAGYQLPGLRASRLPEGPSVISETVRQMRYGEDPFQSAQSSDYTAGQRIPFLVAFTTPVQSYSQVLFGQSDDPRSPHYSDQASLASRRELRSNLLEPEELLRNLESQVTLHIERSATPSR